MTFSNDDDLRKRFHALGSVDQATRPAFGAVRAKPDARAPRRLAGAVLFVWGLAAVAVLAVGLVTYGGRRVDPSVPSIMEWQSPTASLLQGQGLQMLSPAPMTSSVLDQFIPLLTIPKGN